MLRTFLCFSCWQTQFKSCALDMAPRRLGLVPSVFRFSFSIFLSLLRRLAASCGLQTVHAVTTQSCKWFAGASGLVMESIVGVCLLFMYTLGTAPFPLSLYWLLRSLFRGQMFTWPVVCSKYDASFTWRFCWNLRHGSSILGQEEWRVVRSCAWSDGAHSLLMWSY